MFDSAEESFETSTSELIPSSGSSTVTEEHAVSPKQSAAIKNLFVRK